MASKPNPDTESEAALQAVEDALSGAEGNPAKKAAPSPEIDDDFEDLVGKVAEAANDLRDNDIAVEPAAVKQPPKAAAARKTLPGAPQRPAPQRRIEAGEPLEDPFAVLGRHAGAGVLDHRRHPRLGGVDADGDLGADR